MSMNGRISGRERSSSGSGSGSRRHRSNHHRSNAPPSPNSSSMPFAHRPPSPSRGGSSYAVTPTTSSSPPISPKTWSSVNSGQRQQSSYSSSSRVRLPPTPTSSNNNSSGGGAGIWGPWNSDTNNSATATPTNTNSSGGGGVAIPPSLAAPPLSAFSPSKSWDSGDDHPIHPRPKMMMSSPIGTGAGVYNHSNNVSWMTDTTDSCSVQSCDVLAMGGGGGGGTSSGSSSPDRPYFPSLPSDRSVMSDTLLLESNTRRGPSLRIVGMGNSISQQDRQSRRAMALQAAHERVERSNKKSSRSGGRKRAPGHNNHTIQQILPVSVTRVNQPPPQQLLQPPPAHPPHHPNMQQEQQIAQQQQLAQPQQMMPSMVVVPDDDVSSLGGVEDHQAAAAAAATSPSLMRMALAIKTCSARPSSLTPDERALWDAVQKALERAGANGQRHQDGNTSSSSTEPQPQHPQQQSRMASESSVASSESWESRYNQVQEQAVEQRNESQRSLRALQRVLADATDQRDKALSELEKTKQKSLSVAQEQAAAAAAPLTPWQEEVQVLQNDLATKDARIAALEGELAAAKQQQQQQQLRQTQEAAAMAERIPTTTQQQELGTDERNSSSVDADSNNDETADLLRKELRDKTSALESAKMIITSLEHASGSHAADMRNKLKSRDDELTRLKSEALDRQKSLDSLALELRDSRRAQATRNRTASDERDKVAAVIARLDRNVSEIRSAVVVFEATQDTSAVEKMSDLLGDSLAALRERMEALDNNNSADDRSAATGVGGNDEYSVGSSSEAGSRLSSDERRLRRELEEMAATIRRLEEELQGQIEECRIVRVEAEHAQKVHEEEMQKYKVEIQNLRAQYSTIMTVLARKERELVVLRDSLKVDDDVGYISDDASDGDEEDGANPVVAPTNLDTSMYDPSQTEALATLLAQGGGGIDLSNNNGVTPGEVEALKCQLQQAHKQLKMEKESLANAKMIISSLEKANKSMMEDLRSRLQDSNTAIASLLEKSVGSDKTTAALRQNLETLQREKDNEKERFRTEIERLRGMGGGSGGGAPWPAGGHMPANNGIEEKKELELMITETID